MPSQDNFTHCADLVRSFDHDRFLSGLFVSGLARSHLYALYAFNVEVARIAELVSDPLLGEIRLQWWREALEAAFAGDIPRAHPVAHALTEAIRARALPMPLFEALLDARAQDVSATPPATLAGLEHYAQDTSAGVMRLAVAMLSRDAIGTASLKAIDHAGIGMALVGLIRAAGFHASRQRVYLPLDLLEQHGLTVQTVLSGRITTPLRRVIHTVAECAAVHLERARAVTLPREILPAILPAAVTKLYLPEILRDDFDPFPITRPVPGFRRQLRLLRVMLQGRL